MDNIEKSVKEMLEESECHFAWRPDAHGRIPAGCSYVVKIKEKKVLYGQDNEPFLMATYGLLLAYEHGRQGDLIEARDILTKIQSDAAKMDGATPEEREALQYLTSCNLAHVHFLMGDSHAARETLRGTPEYLDLREKVKAQILCAKAAAFSQFSKESFPYALELYREGVEMDPENYNLHLGIGVTLRRIRRIETIDEIPSDEEETALRTALRMKRCQSSLIFLAESLREHALALATRQPDDRLAAELNEEALALYTEVSADPSADGKSLVRCGDGFLKLPPRMQDLHKAEECYLKAHDLFPNDNMVNHKLGVFYSRRNRPLAEKFLSAAINPSRGKGNFAAHTTYVSLKLDHDPTFDVATEWQIMLERYPELIDQILLHLLQMQYFSQFDPGTGLHHAKEALDTLLQMKKPIQTFGGSHHLSHDGRRLRMKRVQKKFTHEHLLEGLQYLRRRLPRERVAIESMVGKVSTWVGTYGCVHDRRA